MKMAPAQPLVRYLFLSFQGYFVSTPRQLPISGFNAFLITTTIPHAAATKNIERYLDL